MIPGEQGIKAKQAALRIGMSVSFLRASDCPKHRKLGNGAKRRPVIIYYASEVDAWWAAREVGALQEAS